MLSFAQNILVKKQHNSKNRLQFCNNLQTNNFWYGEFLVLYTRNVSADFMWQAWLLNQLSLLNLLYKFLIFHASSLVSQPQ
jgi:hypothetical protein